MLLTILWHERILHHHLNAQEIFRFSVEHDAAFELQYKKGEWMLTLSGTLRFENSDGLEKRIDDKHDQFCYVPFYQSVDLLYSEQEGYERYKTYPSFSSYLYLGPKISENSLAGDECWAEISSNWPKQIKQLTSYPGLYVNGFHCLSTNLNEGDLIEIWDLKIIVSRDFFRMNQPSHYCIELKNKRFQLDEQRFYHNQKEVLLPFRQKFQFEQTIPFCSLVFPDIDNLVLKQKPQNILFSMGPAVMMAAASLVAGLFMLKQMRDAGQNSASATLMILLPAVMIFSAIFWPLLQLCTASFTNFMLQKKRYKKTLQILKSKQEELQAALTQQKLFLCNQLLIHEKLGSYLFQNHEFLFSRQPTWQSFGTVILGIGKLKPAYSIQLPEFSIQTKWDRKIANKLQTFKSEKRIFDAVPISVSLLNKQTTGIVLDRKSRAVLIPQLLFQLCFWHSPYHLHAIWNAHSKEEEKNWLQWLPHFRLDEIRLSGTGSPDSFLSYMSQCSNSVFLVFCDQIEYFETWKKVQKEAKYQLFLLFLCDDFNDLPYGCDQFIMLIQNKGKVLDEQGHCLQEFESCKHSYPNSRELALTLFRLIKRENFSMKKYVGLFDLLQVTKNNFSIEKNWNNATLDKKIEIPLGLDNQGKLVYLDISENGQGPHGLIAGMTGSGKSELLLSFILCAACLYSPIDLQFVILDFKGGSLTSQLMIKQSVLPHLVASMDNMNPATIKRSFLYLKQECQKRQLLFQKAQNKAGIVINSIDTYRQFQKKDVELESLAHLVILVDEFAELKQQEPEFMQELIRIARIGRSLGLHLILATQRPSGIVDEQMWSNFSFKLCLKVAQGQDSLEMIHDISASLLQQSGECYFLSGQQKIRFKAAWAHQEANKTKKELILFDQYARPDQHWHSSSKSKITQAVYLLEKIQENSLKRQYSIQPLWLPLPKVHFKQSDPLQGIRLGKIDNPYVRTIEELIHPFDHGILLSQDDKMIEHFITCFILGCVVNREVFCDVILVDPFSQLSFLKAHPAVLDHITLQQIDVVERLFIQLVKDCQYHHRRHKPLFLVVLQPQILLEHIFDIATSYSRLLLEGVSIGCFLLFVSQPSIFPVRFWQSLHHRYVMGLTQTSDIVLALEKNQRMDIEQKEEGWIYAQQPLQFFLPKEISFCCLPQPRYELPRMPRLLEKEWLKNSLLYLGVDVLTCQPVYFDPLENNNLLILSQNEELLELKRNQLTLFLTWNQQLRVLLQLPHQIDIQLQDFFQKQEKKYIVFQSVFKLQQSPWRQYLDYRTILWLGDGIQDQYLFAVPQKCDNANLQLRVYINRGKMIKMKGVGE